jgi:hypothetical protein
METKQKTLRHFLALAYWFTAIGRIGIYALVCIIASTIAEKILPLDHKGTLLLSDSLYFVLRRESSVF